MFTIPASTTARLLAKAGVVAGLLTATMVAAPGGAASAGDIPDLRPLTISTRCEGTTPIATISVHNDGLPELFFDVLENGSGVLASRLVARNGTQVESVEYPATGPGTEYSIETESGAEVGRATLTDPEPDCAADDVVMAIAVDQRPVCDEGTDLLEITVTSDATDEVTVDIVADTRVVRDDLVIAPGEAATIVVDWPRTTFVDPLLEVVDNLGIRLAAQDLRSGSVMPCGDVPGDDTTPVPTDGRPVSEAVPAVVVTGAPSYTG